MTPEPRPPRRHDNESLIQNWETSPPQSGESQLRLAELEAENLRLQRLVSELLIKNERLRELLCQ